MQTPQDKPTEERPNTALNLVLIWSSDIERAEEFYRRLGLIFTKHQHASGSEYYEAELGQTFFQICPCLTTGQRVSHVRLGFQVDSVNATVKACYEAGSRIHAPSRDTRWGRKATIEDPDGNLIELTEKGIAIQE